MELKTYQKIVFKRFMSIFSIVDRKTEYKAGIQFALGRKRCSNRRDRHAAL